MTSLLSVRERLVQFLTNTLQTALATRQVACLRQPPQALEITQLPAVCLHLEQDSVRELANDRVTRELIVRLQVLVAHAADLPDSGWPQADDLLCLAHAALFREVTDHGRLLGVLGVRELDGEWEQEQHDHGLCLLPARYAITYRTLQQDLTQTA